MATGFHLQAGPIQGSNIPVMVSEKLKAGRLGESARVDVQTLSLPSKRLSYLHHSVHTLLSWVDTTMQDHLLMTLRLNHLLGFQRISRSNNILMPSCTNLLLGEAQQILLLEFAKPQQVNVLQLLHLLTQELDSLPSLH